jgi:hypothetical protein
MGLGQHRAQPESEIMLIRYGYELTFNCAEPALMVCLLDAHRDQAQNIRYETPLISRLRYPLGPMC